MRRLKQLGSLAIIGTLMISGAAQARSVYSYHVENATQRSDAGQIEKLGFTYSSDERLSFDVELGLGLGSVADGGWFVLSPGNMPRTIDNELAILYFDFNGGDVWAYRYNAIPGPTGQTRDTYLDTDRFITRYDDVLNVNMMADGISASFNELDVSALAPGTFGPDWTGVSFGEQIGIWAHFAVLDAFSVDAHGLISEFTPGLESWYDVEHRPTVVSEPVGMAALGMAGVAGIALYRRRQQSRRATA